MTNEAIPYQEFGANRLLHRPMHCASNGIPCNRSGCYLPADAHSCAAVRFAVRLAIWSGLRLDWPAAFLPADGNAACLPNPASHDAGTMRIWRVDRAVLPKAEGKPLSLPDWRDAGGARGIRHCKRCAARHCRQALWIYRFFNLSVRHGFAWHCDPTCGGSPSGSGAATSSHARRGGARCRTGRRGSAPRCAWAARGISR